MELILSLGTNLGEKTVNLADALNVLSNTFGRITLCSSIYQTPSWGFEGPDFYNLVAVMETDYNSENLIGRIKEIEKDLGRGEKSGEQYESRMIDIDVLYYGDVILNAFDIIIPHPKISNRKFVLYPLEEIKPLFVCPNINKTIKEMINECDDSSEIKKVEGETKRLFELIETKK